MQLTEYNMLLWLPKKLSKRHQFILQLICFSFTAHILVLGICFWYSRPTILTIKMSVPIFDLSRPITIMPFVRRTGQLKKLAQGTTKKGVSGQHIKGASSKPKQSLIKKPVPVAKQINKSVKNVFEKNRLQKKESPKPKQQEPIKREKEIEKEPQKANIKEPVTTHEQSVQQKAEVEEQEPIVLGQEEFEALKLYQEVHEEITKYWRPPAGLHPKQPCILLLAIDEQGSVDNITVEQSSGVLVHDMAARIAAQKAHFQKELFRQQIRLHF